MARRVSGLLLMAVVASVVACSSTQSATPAAVVETPTPRPSGPLPIRVGMADPGSWTTTAFDPKLTFSVPAEGWMFFFQDDVDEMAIGTSDVEVTAGRVANVVDPASHHAVAAPDDLVGWLASHPELDASAPLDVTAAGIDGRSIEVSNTSAVDVDVFAYPTGNLRVSADTRAVFWVLPYEGPDLVFTGLAPIGLFDGVLPEMQSLVDSVEIEGS
jgi:hypothetical protein